MLFALPLTYCFSRLLNEFLSLCLSFMSCRITPFVTFWLLGALLSLSLVSHLSVSLHCIVLLAHGPSGHSHVVASPVPSLSGRIAQPSFACHRRYLASRFSCFLCFILLA